MTVWSLIVLLTPAPLWAWTRVARWARESAPPLLAVEGRRVTLGVLRGGVALGPTRTAPAPARPETHRGRS